MSLINIKYIFVTFLAIAISVIFFSNKKIQHIDWTFPYFSGAANFERLFDWKINPADYEKVKVLTQKSYAEYKHQRSSNLKKYSLNNYGYVLVVCISQRLFPLVGDLQGVVFLQIIVHLLACLFFIFFVLQSSIERYGFIFLYAGNPIIIHFATFPFYYFWLFIPAFFFAILVLKPAWRFWTSIVGCPFLLFALLVRPTPVFLALFFFALAFCYEKSKTKKVVIAGVSIIFLSGVFLINGSVSSTSPWHTCYVGIGAYPNNLALDALADDQAYKYFYEKSGIHINTHPISGNWSDAYFRGKYLEILKSRYFEIAKCNPWLLVRNATLNSLQVFSVGYIVDRPRLTLISTGLGGVILLCSLS